MFNFFKKPKPLIQDPNINFTPRRIMSTEDMLPDKARMDFENTWKKIFDQAVHPELLKNKVVMDENFIKNPYTGQGNLTSGQANWFAGQSFIGYQMCALLSQQWLISKCCMMPAEDSVRNGYDITVNDGSKLEPKIRDAIRTYDEEFKIYDNLVQFVQMGRIFGIRVALFKVDSKDPDYYYKPFNIDSVRPGSYKGIAQIDPYWMVPQLSTITSSDPTSVDFYQPIWWMCGQKMIHKSHLAIYITEEVPDVLKPSYLYGGVSIPQKIYERVYAAERVANEAPLLALTKRTDVINLDLQQAAAQQERLTERMEKWVYYRDNYAQKILGLGESMQQFDTSLSDLDAVIMTQYQLVASASGSIPSVRLLGTAPKGFNSTGEMEEAFYHEGLKVIQKKGLTPLLDKHHRLLIHSHISPKFKVKPFKLTVVWRALDEMTAKEKTEIYKSKAETGAALINSGVIDPSEERNRLINDPDSGYEGLISTENMVDFNAA